MNKTFSVKYLVESIVNPPYDGKTYEEVIMLIRADSSEMAAQKLSRHCKDHSYENAVGGMTTWCVVQALDCFELVDEIEGDIDFKEVYSRYILVEAGMTPDEVIRDYSLDK